MDAPSLKIALHAVNADNEKIMALLDTAMEAVRILNDRLVYLEESVTKLKQEVSDANLRVAGNEDTYQGRGTTEL